MKLYRIISHIERWLGNQMPDEHNTIIKEDEVERLSNEWGKPVESLLPDLDEIGAVVWEDHNGLYDTKEDALEACDVTDLDTEGMVWNGEMYWNRDTNETWWPVLESELDEDGELIQADTIGYIKGY